MAKQIKQEVAVIDFTKFSVARLPELKGKKEEIEAVIKANPIVEIIDNPTYELAKKSRTAVRSLRTSLEGEQKSVKKRIKEFVVDLVDKEYDTLVLGVKSAEQSRQSPIDAWETKKEEERLEKVRLEELRVKNIKDAIQTFKDAWIDNVNHLRFDGIAGFEEMLEKFSSEFDREKLAEFEILFDDALLVIRQFADAKIQTLTEQEQIRIDSLIMAEKNSELKAINDWRNTWDSNISTLKFSDIAEVKESFAKLKLHDFRHLSADYEETYLSTEKRLHSQIEFVSKAEEQRIDKEKFDKEQFEISEKNRIALKKFQKEKAEFEKKQAEAKFKERKNILSDEGYWDLFFVIECAEEEDVAKSKILAYSEEEFDKFVKAVIEARTDKTIDTTQEVDFEEKPSEIVSGPTEVVSTVFNSDEDDVHEIATAKYIDPEENIHSYEALADYFITVWNKGGAVKVELTFLEKDYDKFKEKSIQEILQVHLPTKKQ